MWTNRIKQNLRNKKKITVLNWNTQQHSDYQRMCRRGNVPSSQYSRWLWLSGSELPLWLAGAEVSGGEGRGSRSTLTDLKDKSRLRLYTHECYSVCRLCLGLFHHALVTFRLDHSSHSTDLALGVHNHGDEKLLRRFIVTAQMSLWEFSLVFDLFTCHKRDYLNPLW